MPTEQQDPSALPTTSLCTEDAIQEAEYEFPYHYLVTLDNEGCNLTRSWPWGYKYIAGLELIHSLLAIDSWNSVLEVGCGDGFVLGSIKRRFPNRRCVGVDYSERAIRFARAFYPTLDFRCLDFTKESLNETFDRVVLTEVLEHIHPSDAPGFLRSLVCTLKPTGKLLITVPHSNQPLLDKHFRHFDETLLRSCLAECFVVDQIVHFDRHTRFLAWLQKLFVNNRIQITHAGWQRAFLNYYRSRHLKADPSNAWRIAAICSPLSTA